MAQEKIARGTRREEVRYVEDGEGGLKVSHLVRPVGGDRASDVAVLPQTPSVWEASLDEPRNVEREVADPTRQPPRRGA